MENKYEYVTENLKRIMYNVNEAVEKYGRKDGVRVMAVTKTVDPDAINLSIKNGITLLGENRVQEYLRKKDSYDKRAEVHFIGHLQRNKVKQIINEVTMIESVGSIELCEEIDKQCKKAEIKKDILIEVNIGQEESKSGFLGDKLKEDIYKIANFKNIKVQGMMCIPPNRSDEKIFNKVYQLYIDIRDKKIDNINICLLSLGMTADYIQAIKYGSNIVRIGTGLFGTRNYTEVKI